MVCFDNILTLRYLAIQSGRFHPEAFRKPFLEATSTVETEKSDNAEFASDYIRDSLPEAT